MKKIFNNYFRPIIRLCGIDVVRYSRVPRDFDEQSRTVYNSVKPYTMTGPERVNALVEGVKYVVEKKIEGDFVECGVWKGGSTMAMALALQQLGDTTREIYLYDTFAGMSTPSDIDISLSGGQAKQKFEKTKTSQDASNWASCSLEKVKTNVFRTGYPKEKFHFVKGKVEDTIPQTTPEKIALLRLDTDWYESTKHELLYLFPRLSPNGVILIDDYGHWQGARKAVDEYISENGLHLLLNRIDYTGRIGIKTQ